MSKALAGKRYFEAQGRCAMSRGLPPKAKSDLPGWAQAAFLLGWFRQTEAWK